MSRNMPVPDTEAAERVGLVLVHGIGEQKRFEHLDNQGRQLIRALKAVHPDQTVEIEAPDTATFHAEQATWHAGGDGSVQVLVPRPGRPPCRIHIHEVWWTDINERPSIPKQIRFWLWGLSVWIYPRLDRDVPGLAAMHQHAPAAASTLWSRLRLFGIGSIFTLGALPLGLLLPTLQRVFNLRAVPLLPLVANYISAVKLFVQPHRDGDGLVHPANEDFLDSLDEPPRVSVRRRMIRAIGDVACQNYDRWYIVAHSQGTVAAFNGLMETAEAWPGYFTQAKWKTLKDRDLVSATAPEDCAIPPTLPRAPAWNTGREKADRKTIFSKFGGLITLGSPIEKFATIWPTRVPASTDPAMPSSAFWFNIYDPHDPVSGLMRSFAHVAAACCPAPVDIGYRTSPFLLVGHTKYLARSGGRFLSDRIATLLVDDIPLDAEPVTGSFTPGSPTHHLRRLTVWLQWLLLYVFLALLAGWTFILTYPAIRSSMMHSRLLRALLSRVTGSVALPALPEQLPFLRITAAAVGVSIVAPLLTGLLFWAVRFRPERPGSSASAPGTRAHAPRRSPS